MSFGTAHPLVTQRAIGIDGDGRWRERKIAFTPSRTSCSTEAEAFDGRSESVSCLQHKVLQ